MNLTNFYILAMKLNNSNKTQVRGRIEATTADQARRTYGKLNGLNPFYLVAYFPFEQKSITDPTVQTVFGNNGANFSRNEVATAIENFESVPA